MRAPTPWQNIPDIEIIDQSFGFIYKITNLVTGRMYIGKKQFWTTTNITPHLKRKRMVRDKPSDWRVYRSSSKQVGFDIEAQGLDAFKFEILSVHPDNKSLIYAEVEAIITSGALRLRNDDGSRPYYNCGCDAIRSPL